MHSQECDNKFCLPFSVQNQKQNKKKLCLYVAVVFVACRGEGRGEERRGEEKVSELDYNVGEL